MADRDAIIRGRFRPDEIPSLPAPQVIGPTVTRRPVLDAMLAQSATVAAKYLDKMAALALSDQLPSDKKDIDKFTAVCELVLKQTRLEMAVEKHVEERTGTLQIEEVSVGVQSAIAGVLAGYDLPDGLESALVDAVMGELGLDG